MLKEKFLLDAKGKKKSEQVVSFLSGTFPPVHLFSAQSLSMFIASPCLTQEAAGCQDDFHSPSALPQQLLLPAGTGRGAGH